MNSTNENPYSVQRIKKEQRYFEIKLIREDQWCKHSTDRNWLYKRQVRHVANIPYVRVLIFHVH
jgi:hypothetical protein